MKLILLLALVVQSIPVSAQVLRDYRCRIERVAMQQPLPKSSMEFWQKAYAGKEFTVERLTGLMAGALKNSYAAKPVVIDHGSDQNSYKVVTTMKLEQGAGVGSNVYLLLIREFEKGPEKPFIFVDNDEIYSGVCTHF